MSKLIREKLEDYFASINPTSSRMMEDIISSREEHSKIWDTLPYEEQSEIEWRSIVKADILKKYETTTATKNETNSFPILKIRPGEKIVCDDDNASTKSFGCSWRDEHSAPFRWETQSQLELDVEPEDLPCVKTKVLEKKLAKSTESVRSVKRPEVPPPPVPLHALPPIPPHDSPTLNFLKDDSPIYAKVNKRKSASSKTLAMGEIKAHRKAKEDPTPAVPPRMSVELRREMDITKYKTLPIDFDDIPKTGFDFLDNW